MADNLLSISNINLFGLIMEDIDIVDSDRPWKVRLVSADGENITPLSGQTAIDGVQPKAGDFVLVWQQPPATAIENGVYRTRGAAGGNWVKIPLEDGDFVVSGSDGKTNRLDNRKWKFIAGINSFELSKRKLGRRRGTNKELEDQLTIDARFARIYGFGFEGSYYDLPRPIIFLVHGDGDIAAETKGTGTAPRPSRAPREPDLTGLVATGFDFADEVRVWSYDKGDYTIRMDVETGMFEDVLLAAMLGGELGGLDARGMQARGMQARGMQARGMQARGMQARGGGSSD